MCQLGSNIARFTIDGTEHIAHVKLLQDVISSLLSDMSHDIWLHDLICFRGNVNIFSIFGAIISCSLILELN